MNLEASKKLLWRIA